MNCYLQNKANTVQISHEQNIYTFLPVSWNNLWHVIRPQVATQGQPAVGS